jgi:DNA polymerase-3 subunit delta'
MPLRDIVGHGPLVELLRVSASHERMPQSLIFAGPEGVGKRAVARALAQAVNCPNRQNGDACGRCNVCLRIGRGQFSDVVWLDKGGEASIKIKALRERILDVVGYRPFEGARRVYIIDPADELTSEAQDALLKTLEEPPPTAMLILVTAYPDTLLSTIQSRCRRLRFGLLAEEDVARVLVDRLEMTPAVARRLASISGGSLSRALSEEAGDFDEDRAAVLGLLRAARGAAVTERLKASAALAQHGSKRRDREALAARLAILASLIRDLGVLAAGATVPLANADLDDDLQRLRQVFQPARLIDAFAAVHRADAALGRNASPKIVADWLAVTL